MSPANGDSSAIQTPPNPGLPVAPEPGFNDDESGAHVVFGIARRVPSPNILQKNLNTRIVSDPAK